VSDFKDITCTKFDFRSGSTPNHAGGLKRCPRSLGVLMGLLRGRNGKGMEENEVGKEGGVEGVEYLTNG